MSHLKGIPCASDAHLFARYYPYLTRQCDTYEAILRMIRKDIERGYSWWLEQTTIPSLEWGMDTRFSSRRTPSRLRQKLPGLCAICGATSFPELARRIWIDWFSPRGWHGGTRIAIFEGQHTGYDGAGFPLFKPARLLALVEDVWTIRESHFARCHLERIRKQSKAEH